MAFDAADGLLDDLGIGIGFDGGDQVEIVADGGLVGAHLRPLVADEADALGGGEAGFDLSHQGRVNAGRIGAAVVALAAGIGKEEAGCGRLQAWSRRE